MIPIPEQFAALLIIASVLFSTVAVQGPRACDRGDGCGGGLGASAPTDVHDPAMPQNSPRECPQPEGQGESDAEVELSFYDGQASPAPKVPSPHIHPEAEGARLECRAHKFFRPPKHLL